MTALLVILGIALLVGAYLAFDWWLAGRKKSRMVENARHAQIGNASVDYANIQNQSNASQFNTWNP